MTDLAPDDEARLIERRDGADAWLDQARWLYQQESARLDTVRARAATLLGFSGGILALLARQQMPAPGTRNLTAWISVIGAIAGTVTIAISALFFAFVLWNVLVTRPSHETLQAEWNEWRRRAGQVNDSPKRKVYLSRDFANVLFRAESGAPDSPLATASRAATSRSSVLSFGAAIFTLGLAEVALSIVAQLIGGLK